MAFAESSFNCCPGTGGSLIATLNDDRGKPREDGSITPNRVGEWFVWVALDQRQRAALATMASSCDRHPERDPAAHTIDFTGMDRSVRPGDDFFRYANGQWFANMAIPADHVNVRTWTSVTDLAEQRTHELLEAIARGGHQAGSDDRKIADYYTSYLDESRIDRNGLAPVAESLRRLAAIQDRRSLTEWACATIRADVDPLNNTNFYTEHLFGAGCRWMKSATVSTTRAVNMTPRGGSRTGGRQTTSPISGRHPRSWWPSTITTFRSRTYT
jgi:hypothetical protein